MIGIKRKTNNNQTQSSRASSSRKTSGGSKARTATKSSSASKGRSKHSSRSRASTAKFKSIASDIRNTSRKFIKEHGIEDSIKSALIEFIKKYKF